jgi:PAS domain S-box-containing protein
VNDEGSEARRPVVSPVEALEFLSRVGTLLSASFDYEQTLRKVATLAVPELADWCAVYVTDDQSGEREVTSEHTDPEIEGLLLDIRRQRRQVEGASESLRVLESGRSILATELSGQSSPDITAERRPGLEKLAARSYMIVPLLARGRVFGTLTLLSTRAGRHYTPEDLVFAETFAVRCALAIDNARLYEAAERSRALLDTVFSTAPVGLALVDTNQRYVRVNPALAALNGRSAEAHVGHTLEEVLGPLGKRMGAVHRSVIRSGEPQLGQESSGELPGAPGRTSHWLGSHTPVRGTDGHIVGVAVTVIDITERKALLEAEREARMRADLLTQAEREARVRADFLARAGAILDSSLDYQETLANVARITVPEVADWCAVSTLDADGRLELVAAAHGDPAKQALAEDYYTRFPPEPDATGGMPNVGRTGVTEFVPEISDEMLVAALPDPDQLAMIRQLGLRSSIVAPLKARGRIFGTLALVNAESGRAFGPADVQLAEELARRAGVAIDNARLYTERTRIAHTLQVKLLPDRLPEIPEAQLAARYRAAGELNEVGGDFYDVFPRSQSEWALVVGDVSGKGAEAAAITAMARYTLRAAALECGSASEALERLNVAMLTDAFSQFATAALAHVSPLSGGGLKVQLCLGGHPQPLVLRASGEVEAVGAFGSVLGVIENPSLQNTDVTLHPGDLMLLYTDGVTEAGPRGATLGEAGLTALLSELARRGAWAVVDGVEQAVVNTQAAEPRDDIALLAIQALETSPEAS